MQAKQIREVLQTGECAKCQAEVIFKENSYECSEDNSHFKLQVNFEGGEKVTATLNGTEVPSEELKDVDW